MSIRNFITATNYGKPKLIDTEKYVKMPEGDGLYISKEKLKEFGVCGGEFENTARLQKRKELFKKL